MKKIQQVKPIQVVMMSLCVTSLLSVMKNGGSSGENGHVR